jgi:hypothetical protein
MAVMEQTPELPSPGIFTDETTSTPCNMTESTTSGAGSSRKDIMAKSVFNV